MRPWLQIFMHRIRSVFMCSWFQFETHRHKQIQFQIIYKMYFNNIFFIHCFQTNQMCQIFLSTHNHRKLQHDHTMSLI